MFVSANRSVPVTRMGDFWDTIGFRNSWWTRLIGAQPIQVPPTPQEVQDLTNAAVRAHGIDPSTNQLVPGINPSTVAQNDGVDPNDPAAVAALVTRIKAQEATKIQADFQRNKDELNNTGSFPWGTVLLAGGGLLVGSAVFIKLIK